MVDVRCNTVGSLEDARAPRGGARCAASQHCNEAAHRARELVRVDEALALLRLAGRQGAEVALVTTTEPGTAQVVADKLHAQGDQPLRCVVDRSQVQREKPQPDAYLAALRTLNIDPADAVAIEDTPESAASAVAANIECFGLPGTFAAGRAFPKGVKHIPCSAEQLLGQFSDLDALRATE